MKNEITVRVNLSIEISYYLVKDVCNKILLDMNLLFGNLFMKLYIYVMLLYCTYIYVFPLKNGMLHMLLKRTIQRF